MHGGQLSPELIVFVGLWKRVSALVSSPKLRPVVNVYLIHNSGTRRKGLRGETILPVSVGNVEMAWKVLVVDGLNCDVLLGRDFLSCFGGRIDF